MIHLEFHVKWGLQWTNTEQNERIRTIFSVDPQFQISVSPVSGYTNEKGKIQTSRYKNENKMKSLEMRVWK
jgi:hypothetical protein